MSTKKTLDGIGETTKKGLHDITINTKKTMDDLGENTRKVVDTHVAPHIEVAKQVSVRTMESVNKSTREFTTTHIQPTLDKAAVSSQRTYTTTTTFIYNNRHYFWNSAPNLVCGVGPDIDEQSWKYLYLLLEEATARSFGQVVFCNNPITGILIWLAILFSSPLAGLCSLLSVVTVRFLSCGLARILDII
jgi:hypothetical protein